MNFKTIRFAVLLFLGALTTRAQIEHDLDSRNRFHIGPTLHFNVTANLYNIPVPANLGPQYDDGFVGVDISGNVDGRTWNWGYRTNNQVVGGGTELELHGVSSPRDGTTDKMSADNQLGLEFGYGREFWRLGDPKAPTRIGFEFSFTANSLGMDTMNTVSGIRARRTDTYSLSGIVVPGAPYGGSFEGPLPPNPPMPTIMTNIISTSTTNEFVTATQNAQLEGTYWGFRIGPFMEIPISGRFQAQVGLGLTGVHVDATLSYIERFTTTGTGAPPFERRHSRTTDSWVIGGYLGGKMQYWLNPAVALYLGGDFQIMQNFSLTAADKNASIDFGKTIGITAGVIYSF